MPTTTEWSPSRASREPGKGVASRSSSIGLIYELKDGRVIRITNYLTHAEALEAAGLRE